MKLLIVSDDIRIHTGLSTQVQSLSKGLIGKNLQVTLVGGSLINQLPTPVVHDGIKIYPVYGYSNTVELLQILSLEKPDAILIAADPRYIYEIVSNSWEIRQRCPLFYWHVWDNYPVPYFNLPLYNSVDHIFAISKLTFIILQALKVNHASYIPHGFDPQVFYPLPEERRVQDREKLGIPQDHFVIFFNGRNISRKRLPLLIQAVALFNSTVTNKVTLLCNTRVKDIGGPNILKVIEEFARDVRIIINQAPITASFLNSMYNISDVTVNVSLNEGFGLPVGESILAGTPVLAPRTGGIPDQMISDDGTIFGHFLKTTQSLYGDDAAPYIYVENLTSFEVLDGLLYVYENKDVLRETVRTKGREHIIKNFNIDSTVHQFYQFLIHYPEQRKIPLWEVHYVS